MCEHLCLLSFQNSQAILGSSSHPGKSLMQTTARQSVCLQLTQTQTQGGLHRNAFAHHQSRWLPLSRASQRKENRRGTQNPTEHAPGQWAWMAGGRDSRDLESCSGLKHFLTLTSHHCPGPPGPSISARELGCLWR